MKPFDVFITYMSWDNGDPSWAGGKNRPVLAFILADDTVDVYQITSKFESKSEAIQSQYFKINDWSQAGLDMQSYVDTGTLITLTMDTFKGKTPIGHLTESDKKRFLDFLDL